MKILEPFVSFFYPPSKPIPRRKDPPVKVAAKRGGGYLYQRQRKKRKIEENSLTTGQSNPFDRLPPEVIRCIFERLDPPSLNRAGQTCKRFHSLAHATFTYPPYLKPFIDNIPRKICRTISDSQTFTIHYKSKKLTTIEHSLTQITTTFYPSREIMFPKEIKHVKDIVHAISQVFSKELGSTLLHQVKRIRIIKKDTDLLLFEDPTCKTDAKVMQHFATCKYGWSRSFASTQSVRLVSDDESNYIQVDLAIIGVAKEIL